MPALDQKIIAQHLAAGLTGATTSAKGKALEDMICYVFGLVPGIHITRRNTLNVFHTEEIDVALWNERASNGFHFTSEIILIECKNWSAPVGSSEISWFDTKLRNRGLNFGILVCANGITGDPNELSAAHAVIAAALREQRRLLVIKTSELQAVADTDALLHLIKEKLCDLAVSGTVVI